jgi:hypothetical protein
MTIVDHILPIGEYYADIRKKESIFIHHTAGGHRPDWTIDGWAHDRTKTNGKLAVATAYVIGGLSTSTSESSYDGVVYRAFDEKYWAHHLGLKQQNNRTLNQRSIAIELCNYGPLTKTREGVFINYVNKSVPLCMVGILDQPFRGFRYYHKYTDKQLDSLRALILDLSKRHNINVKSGMVEYMTPPFGVNQAFELSDDAIKGKVGLWTHSNVRRDKSDTWPQPELIELIRSL